MKRLFGRQLVQPKVVLGIEAGKPIRATRRSRGGKIGTDQSVSICRMKGEPVCVDKEAHHDSEKHYDKRKREDDEELNTPGIRVCNLIIQAADRPHHSRASSSVTQLLKPVKRKFTSRNTTKISAGAKET